MNLIMLMIAKGIQRSIGKGVNEIMTNMKMRKKGV